MNLLSAHTKRTISHSIQTFVVAFLACAFAVLLTFVEDFCVKSKRPDWLTIGIEVLSVIIFIGDALVVLAVVARIVFLAIYEFVNEVRKR